MAAMTSSAKRCMDLTQAGCHPVRRGVSILSTSAGVCIGSFRTLLAFIINEPFFLLVVC